MTKNYIHHCLTKHQNEGNFSVSCVVKSCKYTKKSWNAFKIHLQHKHAITTNYTGFELVDDNNSDVEAMDGDEGYPLEPNAPNSNI